jgi:hypothetical protein
MPHVIPIEWVYQGDGKPYCGAASALCILKLLGLSDSKDSVESIFKSVRTCPLEQFGATPYYISELIKTISLS